MRKIEHGVLLERVGNRKSWGEWDCIFRSALGAMVYDDFELMRKCKQLLEDRERWPKEISKPSKRMTRDPYIMTICAYTQILDTYMPRYVSETKIPWYLYRPHVWAWRKYLITGDPKWKRRYERRAILGLKISRNRMYSLHFEAWMAYVAKVNDVMFVIEHKYSPPEWNLLLWMLIGGSYPERLVDRAEVEAYKPKDRNQWTEETWRETGYYDGPYQLDKDILTYILNLKPIK